MTRIEAIIVNKVPFAATFVRFSKVCDCSGSIELCATNIDPLAIAFTIKRVQRNDVTGK